MLHWLARYPAGIIANSDGNGKKVDSMVIMINIPKYQKCETALTM